MQRLYSPCQIVTLGQKLKFQKKHVNIHSTNHLQLFCAKNHSKKPLNIREMTPFWKFDHHAKAIAHAKFSLTLAQKLKFLKTCQNPFYKSFRLVLCKKTAPKNTKYPRNETFLKIAHHAKAIAHAKSSLWVKN